MRNTWIIVAAVAILGIVLLAYGDAQRKGTEAPTTNAGMLEKAEAAEVVTEEPGYFDGITGYYAAPKAAGSYPGVVMIHEWWGLNDQIKQSARQLAAEGYRVLAVNLHEAEAATTTEQARALVGRLDQDRALQHMKAAIMHLRAKGSSKIATLGWCFGGGQSMQLALSGERTDATVIYYGQLVTDQERLKRDLKAPLLGIFGAEDQSVKIESVREFEKSLDAIGWDKEIYVYPGVGHAFANPSGANYAPESTKDAWQKTLAFLGAHLK